MRIGTMILLAGWAVQAAAAHDSRFSLSVCVDAGADVAAIQDERDTAVGEAENIASEVLATAGVRMDWRGMRHCPAGAVRIRLTDTSDSEFDPGVLAYARPFDGSPTITVFYDRVSARGLGRRSGPILGHVFAHELTHILQAIDRHSESGVMKARWTASDFCQMYQRPLSFTDEDIELIQQGLSRPGGPAPMLISAK